MSVKLQTVSDAATALASVLCYHNMLLVHIGNIFIGCRILFVYIMAVQHTARRPQSGPPAVFDWPAKNCEEQFNN